MFSMVRKEKKLTITNPRAFFFFFFNYFSFYPEEGVQNIYLSLEVCTKKPSLMFRASTSRTLRVTTFAFQIYMSFNAA